MSPSAQTEQRPLIVLPRTVYLGALRALVVFSLLVLFPVLFGLPAPSFTFSPLTVAWIFLVVSGIWISYLVLSERPSIFDLVVWIFVYIFFGLSAVAQISHGQFPLFTTAARSVPYAQYRGNYPTGLLFQTELRIAIGIAAYIGGRWLWKRLSGGRKGVERWDRLSIATHRLPILGTVAALIAAALIVKAGPSSFFTSRATLDVAIAGAQGSVHGAQLFALGSKVGGTLQSIFLTIPPFIVLTCLIVSGAWRRYKLLTIALVVINVVTNNPISNARAWFGVVLVGALAAFMDLSRRSRHVYIAAGLLLSLLFSLGYLGVFKSTYYEQNHVSQPIAGEFVQSPDYSMFQQEVDGTIYVQEHGFALGRQLAGSALVYVPHAIWKSKPVATGELVAEVEGYLGSWSSSLWTEFYVDWGYPELIVGFALLGYAFARLDDVFTRSRSRAVKLLLPIVATYSVIFIRGSLQPIIGFGVPILIMFALCLTRTYVGEERPPQAVGVNRFAKLGSLGDARAG